MELNTAINLSIRLPSEEIGITNPDDRCDLLRRMDEQAQLRWSQLENILRQAEQSDLDTLPQRRENNARHYEQQGRFIGESVGSLLGTLAARFLPGTDTLIKAAICSLVGFFVGREGGGYAGYAVGRDYVNPGAPGLTNWQFTAWQYELSSYGQHISEASLDVLTTSGAERIQLERIIAYSNRRIQELSQLLNPHLNPQVPDVHPHTN